MKTTTDGQGNFLTYNDNGFILCAKCDAPLSLFGRDDSGMAGGEYTWECPTHGAPDPPTPCPVCGGARTWSYPPDKGMIPSCASCAPPKRRDFAVLRLDEVLSLLRRERWTWVMWSEEDGYRVRTHDGETLDKRDRRVWKESCGADPKDALVACIKAWDS